MSGERIFTTWLTSVDRVDHAVTDEEFTEHSPEPETVCGEVIMLAPMEAPPGPHCASCTRFLPTKDVRAFVVELVETMKAAEGLDNPAPVIQVITEWRHTAEVHADPELLAILRQPAKDYGSVPAPTV